MNARRDTRGPLGFQQARREMVERQLAGRDITDQRVIAAAAKVPRHIFVSEETVSQAYEDHPLHIGFGQTISQPYIVALMTQALGLSRGERVLEIGTGSGYQTAVLAELAARVYTVERILELSLRAKTTLEKIGYDNIDYAVADGSVGWAEHAPYDAILVAASAPEVPESLKAQLADGGRLVLPVGGAYSQILRRVTRKGDSFVTEDLCPCIFVRLIGKEGHGDA